MRPLDIAACLACVSAASVGQVLMRAAALAAQRSPEAGLRAWLNGTSLLAVSVYLAGMLLWLWVLGRVPVSNAIAFFALTFLFVPLLAHLFLGDPVTRYTWVGAAVIFVGILISVRGAA